MRKTLPRLVRSRGTLEDLLSRRGNGIGLIRLALAVAVVASHAKPLGFGASDLGHHLFGRQTNVGTMAVYGFFVLSGLLITRSARRASLGRYLWHRGLRIFPALWVCLLVTALLVAPLVALRENGTVSGFFDRPWEPGGPLAYAQANWWTGVRQYGIDGLLVETTPWGRNRGYSVFNGALWSLKYEMLCYLAVAVLAVTAVLRQARRFVLATTVALYAALALHWWGTGRWSGPVATVSGSVELPLLGSVSYHWLLYLGFLFALGASFDLYRERVPVNDLLGLGSAVVLALSLLLGGFAVLGLPAFAYLLIWLSVRMPRRLHAVGRRNDYSYGIYIYGFVGQQVMASLGWSRWGFVPFVLMSVAVAWAAAFLSWKLVERPALRLKDWTPALLTRLSGPREPAVAPVTVAPRAPSEPGPGDPGGRVGVAGRPGSADAPTDELPRLGVGR